MAKKFTNNQAITINFTGQKARCSAFQCMLQWTSVFS